MKKYIISITIMLLIFINGGFSQDANLIKNGSFERVEGKLKKRGSIESAVGWTSPSKTKADLFSPKGTEEISTPNNELGSEDPLEGKNYAGIVTYSYNNKEPRTYLISRLNEPLKKGFKYCVSFNISLAEASKYASDNIGVHFSKKEYNFDGEDKTILAETHIMDMNNKVFNARYNWDNICGIYEAKGGEKVLNIGNFSSDKETNYEKMKSDPKVKVRDVFSAYYFVDDVSVILIDDNSQCKCRDANSVDAYASKLIYSKSTISAEDLTDEEEAQARAVYFAFGLDRIELPARADLDSLVFMMKENPDYKMKIKGHHEKMETEASRFDSNLSDLSSKRIDVVINYFEQKGIDKSRFFRNDYRDEQPASTDKTELARAKNRRVEFELVK